MVSLANTAHICLFFLLFVVAIDAASLENNDQAFSVRSLKGKNKNKCTCEDERPMDPWSDDFLDESELLMSKRRRMEWAHAKAEFLNANKTLSWKAGATKRFSLFTHEHRKNYCGVLSEKLEKIGVVLPEKHLQNHMQQQQAPIPRSFDSRVQWPVCAAYINNIRDQSGCGSCWAVALGSVLTDRLCIYRSRSGQWIPQLPYLVSEADILACSGAGGCGGGWPYQALQWVSKNRVTSGSNYSSEAFCKPYPFPPKASETYQTPTCYKSCQYGYGSTYTDDRSLMGQAGPDVGHIDGWGKEQMIQQEVMSNGPVEATMNVYDDLYLYTSGIYWHAKGGLIGAHAVKIIGWDEGYDQWNVYRKWWIVANSWNTDWGENGFFRISRGNDECGLESTAIDFPLY